VGLCFLAGSIEGGGLSIQKIQLSFGLFDFTASLELLDIDGAERADARLMDLVGRLYRRLADLLCAWSMVTQPVDTTQKKKKKKNSGGEKKVF